MKNESLFFTDKTNIGAQHVPVDSKKFREGGLIAPNGKPSKLTPTQYKLVRTPEFKAWFGDWENDPENASKVVDSNGEPLVVYHGTNQDFSTFDLKTAGKRFNEEHNTTSDSGDYGMWGVGFYFSPIKKFSQHYGSKVMKLFLNIRNPFVRDPNITGTDSEFQPARGKDASLKLREEILSKGYDGVIHIERSQKEPAPIMQIVSFYPNQIKLSDGTNTTFDPNNDDIRFEEGGTVLLAPNGKPSNLTPEQYKLVRTPEFKAWFGDWENDPEDASKVIDENGEPLVVYHGSPKKFSTFKGFGHWFTSKKEITNNYGKKKYEVFLKVINPFEISPLSGWDFKSKYKWEDEGGFYDNLPNNINWVVKNSNQIKLADGTNTTFDSNNPDIRFKDGGSIDNEKIVCHNCGWSWKVEDGGDDLYECHRCGCDNTDDYSNQFAGGGNIDINEPFNVNGKTLAERVRILVKQLYPDYKWSVTSSYNKLDVYLLEADFDPFTAKWKEEHPDRELYYNVDDRDFETYNRENNAKITDRAVEVFKPIRDYINKFVYNRNADDPYADYVDYNVYEYTYIGKWDKPYKQVEPKAGKKKPKAPAPPTKALPFKMGDILALSQDKLNSYSSLMAQELSEYYYEVAESINPFSRYFIRFNGENDSETITVEVLDLLEKYVKATKPLFKKGDLVVLKNMPTKPSKVEHRSYFQQNAVKYGSPEKKFLLSGMYWNYKLESGTYADEGELELYKPTATQTPNDVFSIQNIVSKTQWSEGLKKTMIQDFVNSAYENVTPLIGADVRETSKNIENKVDGFSSGKNTYLQANYLADLIHILIDSGNVPFSEPTTENTFIDYLKANNERANEISKELELTTSLALFVMGSKDIANLDSKKYAELMEEFLNKFPKINQDDSTNAN